MPLRKLPSGRWQAKYLHPYQKYKADGARNYITANETFRTKTEGSLWLEGIKTDIARGVWKSPEQLEAERLEAEKAAALAARTFGSYATAWIESRPLTHATRRAYESYLRTHVLPRWGDVPLQVITTASIREWLAAVAPGNEGARKKAYELFRAILNSAVDDDMLPHSPCKRNMLGAVKPAPIPAGQKPARKREPRALTLAELEALAAEVPDYMRTMVLLTGLVGFRAGEVRFLHGRSVTTDSAGTIWLEVKEAVSGEGKDLATGAPKTAKSIRSVPVPTSLRDEVLALADMAGRDGLLFPKPGGTNEVIPYATLYDNVVAAAKRANIGHVSPHDLRHTAVSLARANGAPDTAVRDLVGHTTTSMTSRYTHTRENQMVNTVEAVDRERTRPAEVASMDQWRKQG